jgi:hypothetical protein
MALSTGALAAGVLAAASLGVAGLRRAGPTRPAGPSAVAAPVTGCPAETPDGGSRDPFGGLLEVSAPGAATGHFGVHKFGDRWMLVTPAGHPFWMLGVWAVTGVAATDELGDSYNNRFPRKYGSAAVGWARANQRLRLWGFNTIGPYSYRMVLPTNTGEPEWPGGQQPVKVSFLACAPNPAIAGRIPGAYKNLFAGLDASNSVFEFSRAGGNFPDVYDPGWQTWVREAYANDKELAVYKTSPWFIGYFSDDTDYLSGFASGTDFPTDPPGKYHWHVGYLALVTAPRQSANPYSNPPNHAYTNQTVHTKLALRDFLRAKYGTIASLNAAWRTSYTTFDSDGGWPRGRGLLDESGHRAWSGRDLDPHLLTGVPAAARADLDAFLYEMAKTFFSANRAAFKAVAPNALFLGPTQLGGAGWRSPTRRPILKAAGEFLDVISVSTDGSQAQLDFIAQSVGDKPLIVWEGIVANADSGRFRSEAEAATWNVSTQGDRGRLYQRDVSAFVNGVAGPSGAKPFVGLLWWAWTDSFGERQNWGLVSLLDNAYDGREAVRRRGVDPWGAPTGGEERDYGDAISAMRAANLCVPHIVAPELKAVRLTTRLNGSRDRPSPATP